MKHITKRLALFLSYLNLFLLSPFVLAEAPEPKKIESLAQYRVEVEKVMAAEEVPGLAMVISERDDTGKLVSSFELFGQADIESASPVTHDTMFRIGSISKMFMALSVLKLVEEGKLSLDDRLSDLAPEIEFENPWAETSPVLLVHLLEHTAGWDDLHVRGWLQDPSDNMSPEEMLAMHPHSRLSRWEPGKQHAYSNVGPVVVAFIVEKISGQSFEDYVQTFFFSPLAMEHTTYRYTDYYQEHGASNYFHGAPSPYWFIKGRASGSINTSAKEMANFLSFFLNRGLFNDKRILNESSLDRMEKPLTSLSLSVPLEVGYGLHNVTYPAEGAVYHGHGGSVGSAVAMLEYSPKAQKAYVLLMNINEREAQAQIMTLTKSYLNRDFKSEVIEKAPDFSEQEQKRFSAYYRGANPRGQMLYPMFRLLEGFWVNVEGDEIHLTNWRGIFNSDYRAKYIRVGENSGRYKQDKRVGVVWEENAAGELILRNGRGGGMLKPANLLYEVSFILCYLLAIVCSVVFSLRIFWWLPPLLLRPFENIRSNLVYALHGLHLGTISLAGLGFVLMLRQGKLSSDVAHFAYVFGEPTIASTGFYLFTLLYPLLGIVALVSLIFWRSQLSNSRDKTLMMMMGATHLYVVAYWWYWDFIGLKTWVY